MNASISLLSSVPHLQFWSPVDTVFEVLIDEKIMFVHIGFTKREFPMISNWILTGLNGPFEKVWGPQSLAPLRQPWHQKLKENCV